MATNITDDGVANLSKGAIWLTLAFADIVFNVAVFIGLGKCGDLSAATRFLMRSQLCANGVGIFSAFMMIKVILTGHQFSSNPFLNSLPGGLGVAGIYIQMPLMACMAVNRYVVFCHQEKANRWFSTSRTKLYTMLSLSYGMVHLMTCLLPCCRAIMHATYHRVIYVGDGKIFKQAITLVNDLIVLPTVFVCYSLTFQSIRKIRKSMTVEELKQIRYKTERKVLLQFLTVAGAWVLYSIFYRTQYFIPALSKNTIWVAISESVRLLVFVIDPVVYFCFMRKLRQTILRKLCFCWYGLHSVHPEQNPRIDYQMEDIARIND